MAGAAIFAAILILPSDAAYLGLASAKAGSGTDITDPANIFAPFTSQAGTVQTAKGPNCTHPANGANGADVCNTSNPFIEDNFGTSQGNDQACETCHQPQLGWSITPSFLKDRFQDTHGTGEYFRVNDTVTDPRICGAPSGTVFGSETTPAQNANNVTACVASMPFEQKLDAYGLFIDLAIHRIAIKDDPTKDNFTITAPTTREFGALPIPPGQDSQQPCSVQAPKGVGTCVQTISVFRRPMLTADTFFDSSVLWDGRQNVCVQATPAPGQCPGNSQPIRAPLLESQVSGAAQTLVLATNPCPAGTLITNDPCQQAAHLMTGVFVAMISNHSGVDLTTGGANGGPAFLAKMATPGSGAQPPCTPLVEAFVANSGEGMPPPACAAPAQPASPPNGRGFNLYVSFLPKSLQAGANTPSGIQAIFAFCNSGDRDAAGNEAKIAIACGENIFDNHPVNDPDVEVTSGTIHVGRDSNNVPLARCTTCHAAMNVGDNPNPSFILPLGISRAPDAFVGGDTEASGDPFCATNPNDAFCKSKTFNLPKFKERTSRLPLYTLSELTGPGGTPTGNTVQVTDPGQALITHSFDAAGAMKPPILRSLAVRAPFFHNGAAETLDDLVDFYNQNFSIGLTEREHHDLVAFLKAL